MKQGTEDLRNLSDAECDQVSGGRMLTTLAVGEEDGGCRGPIMTTMALGEEDPRERLGVPLDAGLHL